MDLHADHKLLRFRDEVAQICRPLFDNTAITYFEYARYFKDGRFLELNTNADVTLRYINERCYPDAAEIAANTTKYIFMTSALPLPKATKGAEEKYIKNIKIFEAENISHRIYTNISKENYFDVCGFGTNIDSSLALELFVNNFNFWDSFKEYFISIADKIIQEQYSHLIQLPITRPELVIDDHKLKSERKLTNIQGLPLKHNHIIHGTKLSKQEYATIKQLAHGKTAKEIARELSISVRTVQTYVERIKYKLSCFNKNQLAELYWQSRQS